MRKALLFVVAVLFAASVACRASAAESTKELQESAGKPIAELNLNFVPVAAGRFQMGNDRGHFDERPTHPVTISAPYWISRAEITNAAYEQFAPEHRRFRGKSVISKADKDPVVFVSWEDADSFCKWLSKQTGRAFRLPTEAEWEFARLSKSEAFGGGEQLVENWCRDWYGPYPREAQTDPCGYAVGDARVTRGGPTRADGKLPNVRIRSGNLPADRNRLVGFRVVESALSDGSLLTKRDEPRWAGNVSEQQCNWQPPTDMSRPYFAEPIPYVKIPAGSSGPLYSNHNHDPAITYCFNGDLLAIWYSTITESGRELAIAASRLRSGADSWGEADLFWDVPGRNDHAPALWTDERGTLFHFNGLDVDTGWDELALVMRTSNDHGKTWSVARLIDPNHRKGNQAIASVFADAAQRIYVPCDAVSGGHGGTVLHASSDGGQTWQLLSDGKPAPKFAAGATGAWIAGIHAGVDSLSDGTLLACGRGDSINDKMPMSRSTDSGRTWTYSASPFTPISGGQRLVLRRLKEGPLLLISFTPGSKFKDSSGKEFIGHGMFSALSDDGGQTWPVQKLLTDGKRRELDGLAHTKKFIMDATHAEPKGYLTAVQTPDGIIHLISSGIHYRFNLAWLHEPAKAVVEGS